MKISDNSIIYNISFSQTKSESRYQVGTCVKIRDHSFHGEETIVYIYTLDETYDES